MTHDEACTLLGQQEQASAEENAAACATLAPTPAVVSRLCNTSLAVLHILTCWARAKAYRLEGSIRLALWLESVAERAIDRNGFDW